MKIIVGCGAERDDEFFRQKGFKGAGDFFDTANRLSAIMFRSTWVGNGDRNWVWRNNFATMPASDQLAGISANLD